MMTVPIRAKDLSQIPLQVIFTWFAFGFGGFTAEIAIGQSESASGVVVAWGGWGNEDRHVMRVPTGLTDVIDVAVGTSEAAALRRDGTVATWGATQPGELLAREQAQGIVKVVAGPDHFLALRTDGTVTSWGNGRWGETRIPGGLKDAIDIATSETYSLAVRQDGNVIRWGNNRAPRIPTDLTEVVKVAAGLYHSVALQSDGTVVAWGSDFFGESDVPEGLSDVVDISARGRHTLALKRDGTVIAWGRNNSGETDVPTSLKNVVAIAAGSDFSMALQKDGTIVVWGNSNQQQNQIRPDMDGVFRIAAGPRISMAIAHPSVPLIQVPPRTAFPVEGQTARFEIQALDVGPLRYQWFHTGEAIPGATQSILTLDEVFASDVGDYSITVTDSDGNSAHGTAELRLFEKLDEPKESSTVVMWPLNQVRAFDLPPNLKDVSAVTGGQSHSLALRSNGTVVAWGENRHGELDVPAHLSGVVQTAAGSGYSLALLADGTLVRWGGGTLPVHTLPPSLGPLVQIAAGPAHALGLRANGTVVAWGANSLGETDVPESLGEVTQIATGVFHSVALQSDGTVVAWGQDRLGATDVPADLGNVVAIAAGASFTMALLADGRVAVWGAWAGEQSSLVEDLGPVEKLGGFRTPLALLSSGELISWGREDSTTLKQPHGLGHVTDFVVGDDYVVVQANQNVPVVVKEPEDAFVLRDSTAQFEIHAAGHGGVTYQWFYEDIPVMNETGPLLSIPNVSMEDQGTYSVLVTDSDGDEVRKAAKLRVFEPLERPSDEGYLVAWGGFEFSSFSSQHGPFVSIAAGARQILALRPDGTVTRWGGTLLFNTFPAINDAVAIAAGELHSVILKANGEVVEWGNGGPKAVPSQLQTVSAIAAGGDNTIALQLDGTVVTWGATGRPYGTVPDGLTGVVAVTAGTQHMLVLKKDGTVAGWDTEDGTPLEIPEGLIDVVEIAARGGRYLARKTDGTIVHWGACSFGDCADAPEDLRPITSITAGHTFAAVLQDDGTIAMLGKKRGFTTRFTNRRPAPDDLQNVIAIAGGDDYCAALTTTLPFLKRPTDLYVTVGEPARFEVEVIPSQVGPIDYQWFHEGEAIPGATRRTLVIEEVSLKDKGTYSVTVRDSAGNETEDTAIMGVFPRLTRPTKEGIVVAWGAVSDSKARVPPDLTGVVAISAGRRHSAALLSDGTVVEWGRFNQVFQTDPEIVGIEVGYDEGTLALQSSGRVILRGFQKSDNVFEPSPVYALDGKEAHALALRPDGSITTTGRNQFAIPENLSDVTAVAAGGNHALALQADGTVVAWGRNNDGQADVPEDLRSVIAIDAGHRHSVALREDGTVVAWGQGEFGQTDVPLDLKNVVAISCGFRHTLALKADGTIAAWGANNSASGATDIPPGLGRVFAIAAGEFYNLVLVEPEEPSISHPWQLSLPTDLSFPIEGALRLRVTNERGERLIKDELIGLSIEAARSLINPVVWQSVEYQWDAETSELTLDIASDEPARFFRVATHPTDSR